MDYFFIIISVLVGACVGIFFGIGVCVVFWREKYSRYKNMDEATFQLREEKDSLLSAVTNYREELRQKETGINLDFQNRMGEITAKFETAKQKLRESYQNEQERLKQLESQKKNEMMASFQKDQTKFNEERVRLNHLYSRMKNQYKEEKQRLAESYEEDKIAREKRIEDELRDLLNIQDTKQKEISILRSEIQMLKDSLEASIEHNRQELARQTKDQSIELALLEDQKYKIQNELKSSLITIRQATELREQIPKLKQLIAEKHQEIEEVKLEAEKAREDAKQSYAKRESEIREELDILDRESKSLSKVIKAQKNTVEGYGNEYIVPSKSLLDDLAEDMSHTEAGVSLKEARSRSKDMVLQNEAASCDYVEKVRKETAIKFVADAFNGKADSILSRTKHDNFGKLSQQIKDAYEIVNLNGEAFRNARILPEYLDARLDELKWGTIAHELLMKEREEQRRIKEQIREEEKARKEYEKAIRETEKEENAIKKALAKAESEMKATSDSQRAEYEAKLQELHTKLREAEERNQRAVSMAQQTKRGHIYIISNIGSFGENIYKIGMTRRLDPMERVNELGDASVPFSFDVHAMIFSEDAPKLESELHKHFMFTQVNKVNHRKEFFRCDLMSIIDLLI